MIHISKLQFKHKEIQIKTDTNLHVVSSGFLPLTRPHQFRIHGTSSRAYLNDLPTCASIVRISKCQLVFIIYFFGYSYGRNLEKYIN